MRTALSLVAVVVGIGIGAWTAPATVHAQRGAWTSERCDRDYDRRVKTIREFYGAPDQDRVRAQMELYALEDYDACLRSASDR